MGEPWAGCMEVKTHGVGFEDFCVVVVIDLFRDGEGAVFVAETEEVEVAFDVVCVQWGAVGIGDAASDTEGVLGAVGVDFR